MALTKKEQDKINLRGSHTFTQEEKSAGGKRSAEVRRMKKTMRELAAQINDLQAREKDLEDLTLSEEDGEKIDRQYAFLLRVYAAAMAGNDKAMKMWIDLSDDLKSARQELEIEKLRAEVEMLKRGQGKEEALPTFVFTFTDFSMDDTGGKK